MKTKHRHELKENELAHTVAVVGRTLAGHGRTLALGAVAVVVAVLVGVGVGRSGQRAETAAAALLGDAMVTLNTQVVPLSAQTEEGLPAAATLGAAGTFASDAERLSAALPKLEAVVAGYPETQAGLTARYHLAGALAGLARYDEAIATFDAVAEQAGPGSLYGRMALMGRADTEMRAGQLDAAVASWQTLAADTAADLPQDAILMELGRAYQARGDMEEARATFTRVVDEFPTSPYSAEAQRALQNLPG